MKKRPHDCCNIESNIEQIEDNKEKKLKVERCKVCGCRHFKLTLEPGHMGMVMTP